MMRKTFTYFAVLKTEIMENILFDLYILTFACYVSCYI